MVTPKTVGAGGMSAWAAPADTKDSIHPVEARLQSTSTMGARRTRLVHSRKGCDERSQAFLLVGHGYRPKVQAARARKGHATAHASSGRRVQRIVDKIQ